MTKYLLHIFLFFCIVVNVEAQHDHHKMMPDTSENTTILMSDMTHAYSLNLPMNMDGSGTGWLPASSPMFGYMLHSKKWNYMVHGNIFLRYNKQDIGEKGTRGAELWDIPNWFMLMGQRKVGQKGLLHFSAMFSLDYLVVGGAGYPLLFQTGESNNGIPLVDRQHPHDLFSELSVAYSYAIAQSTDVYVYLGYPGEPALGSVAYMHRPSAMPNPDAPLSHHWNDGTHITFGVATIGFRYGKFKWEASSFTGREPDEDRYDFDKPRFDSWSGRMFFSPSRSWAFQISHSYVKSPELLHPDEDVWRTTASAIFSVPLGEARSLNITGLWGVNKIKEHKGENALLLEGAWNARRLSLFGRYEWVQKSTEELNLDEITFGNTLFPVNTITVGFNYNILKFLNTWLAVGSHVIFFNEDNRLNALYGSSPASVEAYVRLSPGFMQMSHK